MSIRISWDGEKDGVIVGGDCVVTTKEKFQDRFPYLKNVQAESYSGSANPPSREFRERTKEVRRKQ